MFWINHWVCRWVFILRSLNRVPLRDHTALITCTWDNRSHTTRWRCLLVSSSFKLHLILLEHQCRVRHLTRLWQVKSILNWCFINIDLDLRHRSWLLSRISDTCFGSKPRLCEQYRKTRFHGLVCIICCSTATALALCECLGVVG